jgi:Kelch motif
MAVTGRLGRFGLIRHLPKPVIALAAAIVITQLPALADTNAWMTNPWQSLAPLIYDPFGGGQTTNPGLEGHCDAKIGSNIYVAFGNNSTTGGSSDTHGLRVYNVPDNQWTIPPGLAPGSRPTEDRAEMYRGVAKGGQLYCVGGRSSTSNWKYDPPSNSWSQIPPIDQLRVGTSAATFANSIFLFGGRNAFAPCSSAAIPPGPAKPGTPISANPAQNDNILRYDRDQNAWFNAGNLNEARSDLSVARVGRYIYIFGGCSSPTATGAVTYPANDVEVFDPKTGVSSPLVGVTMPGGKRNNLQAADPQQGSSANASHLIHVTGGFNSNDPTLPPAVDNHIVFDVDQCASPKKCPNPGGAFLVGKPMPDDECASANIRRSEHELVYGGDRIFAIGGGCPGFGTSIADVEQQKLSGTNTASADSGTASLTAYDCSPTTFPVCDAQPLGIAVAFITGTGFTPLSTITLTSSNLGALPVAVSDVQGEMLTTYVDTACNGLSPETITGDDGHGNVATITFNCPE